MKNKRLETGATVALGALCVALIFHLVIRVRDVHAGAPLQKSVRAINRAFALPDSARKAAAFPDAPVLNVALYQKIQSQTLAAPDRNPFSLPPTPQQLQALHEQAAAAAHPAVAAPPPPPPLPFKAVGYSVQSEGGIEAFLSDSQQVYVLHEGEMFDKNYRVARITSALIEIEDESFHRTVELPFPQ